MSDTWLIVWEGIDEWRSVVDGAVGAAGAESPAAHHIVFGEAGGGRRAVLLVHYTVLERDAVVAALRPRWEHGFVNAVTDLDVHHLATAFDGVADIYERSRPDYPQAAVDHLRARFGIGPGTRVADIGAGTGKFTRMLIPTGADLVAVEPVAGMREVFARVLPGIEILEGTAEAIPLPDASVDVITAAQAAHWFQAGRAFTEIARVLRRGGGLGLIWNVRDESTWPWDEITPVLDRHTADGPRYRQGDYPWMPAAEAAPEFGPLAELTVPYRQVLDVEGVIDRVAGVSYIAALSDTERARALDEVRAILAGGGGPEISLHYITQVYTMDRR